MFVSILFTTTTLIIVLYCYKKYNQNVKKFPGPKPLPLLGSILDFLVPINKYLLTVMNCVKTYGSIVQIQLGYRTVILITDCKLLEHVLTSTRILKKSSFLYDTLTNWLGTGLLTSTDAKWKSHRKMIAPSFHLSILVKFMGIFESVGNNFIEKLRKEVGKPSVDIYPLASLCTLDIICETVMGTTINALNEGQSQYIQNGHKMCLILADRISSIFHQSLYPLTPNYYKEKKALKYLHSYVDNIIDQKIKTKTGKLVDKDEYCNEMKKTAFLDLLLESTVDDKNLTRTELRDEVNTFMFAGHDTSSSTISFTIYLLATNPVVQEKVVEEQRIIFGNNQNAPVTLSDMQNMKYLDLVIKETLRIYPSIPLIARELTEDIKWDGVTLSKGYTLALFIFGLQRDPKHFPDPEKFIPERFENSDGKHLFTYIPFSAGPRKCLGKTFAMMEIKNIISKVIRNFEIHPAEPKHELELVPETVLRSKNGVRISMSEREWM